MAYIDINAWKVGVVARAEAYEWCSFAAAVKGDERARRGYAFMYGNGKPEIVERILKLLGDGPMRPSALREVIGIRNCTHFNRYYLAPMLSQGLIKRTDPNHPQSPQQRYKLA